MKNIHLYRKYTFFLLLLLLLSWNLYADHIPAETQDTTPAFRTAVMADMGKWDAYLGFSGEIRTESPDYYALRTGAYYRLHRNLKMGLFYTLQRGERHDDDWIKSGDNWIWQDSGERLEHLITLDGSPRFILPWIPGKNWVLTSRIRYSYNTYNDHQNILFRPDLSYFLMKNRKPLWNFNAGYALYFPLNFSEAAIYRQGPYLSTLYHLSKSIKLEFFTDYQIRYWTTSKEVPESESSYKVSESRLRVGGALIWTPAF